MMKEYKVKTVTSPVHWTVEVPGSKSITNRALLMASLADGEVELNGVLFSDDSRCFLGSLQSLGFSVYIDEEKKIVKVQGCGGAIPASEGEIYVGSAGTAARFLTAMLGVSAGAYDIMCSPQMAKRPMKPLFQLLIGLGADITWLGEEWHLPIHIQGANAGASYTELNLDISESTQFLSACLLIAPMFRKGLGIHITSEKKDGSYIRITTGMMKEFGIEVLFDGCDYHVPGDSGYCIKQYQIEPDVSAACYFYGAAAVTGGYAKVLHVHSDNMQGDMKFLQVLQEMGCLYKEEADGISITGPAIGTLSGIALNMNDFSDQALTLAALAPYANAPVKMDGIGHIRGQECDRLCGMAVNLTAAGIRCEERQDGITIYPGTPGACRIKTYEDHRVAMAFSLMGLRSSGIVIEDPDCCRKTFEEYFQILDRLTVEENGTISKC